MLSDCQRCKSCCRQNAQKHVSLTRFCPDLSPAVTHVNGRKHQNSNNLHDWQGLWSREPAVTIAPSSDFSPHAAPLVRAVARDAAGILLPGREADFPFGGRPRLRRRGRPRQARPVRPQSQERGLRRRGGGRRGARSSSFTRTSNAPVRVALLFDVSGSMRMANRVEEARQAARHSVERDCGSGSGIGRSRGLLAST